VLSGCMGAGTTDGQDAEDSGDLTAGTTVINNYYNNTTVIENNNTTVIENNPEYITSSARAPWGISGNYNRGETILTINQSAGEGIMKHDWIGMTGSHGTQSREGNLFVDSYCAGNLTFVDVWYSPSTNMNTQTPEWFSGAGLECSHELQLHSTLNGIGENWISIVYERVPVTIE